METNFCFYEKHKKSQYCMTLSKRSIAINVIPITPGDFMLTQSETVIYGQMYFLLMLIL